MVWFRSRDVMGRTAKMTASSEAQWWFRLTAESAATRIVHECEVDFGPVANVLLEAPYALMRGTIKRGMRQTLENARAGVAGA